MICYENETKHVPKYSSINQSNGNNKEKDVINIQELNIVDNKEGSTQSRPLSEASENYLPLSNEKTEKITQLLWIEKEIQHLKHLKQMILHADKDELEDKDGEPIKVKIYENISDYDTGHRQENLLNNDDLVPNTNKKERSKLQTPDSEDSFIKMIEKRKEKLLPHSIDRQKKIQQQQLYTKPYNLEYATLSENVATKNSASTITSTSSSAFISSGSISIPNIGNTNTTTQYDFKSNEETAFTYTERNKRRSIQTQTSDSVKHTNPIFENRSHYVSKTKMIDRTRLNKQQQTKQQAMAYVLTFTGDNRGPVPKNNLENAYLQKQDEGDFDVRTLEEHLSEKHPQIWRRIDQRNQCIKELRKLR